MRRWYLVPVYLVVSILAGPPLVALNATLWGIVAQLVDLLR